MPDPQTPREHIESIKSDFEDPKPRVRDSLHKALAELGPKLGSHRSHFLFELIQNADDNQYAEGVEPLLIFDFLSSDPTGTPDADGCLVVRNNERGLRPQDVDALCQLGKSTKAKVGGYIGEKGLGFKSVFRVSARPHLISGGYAFRFDEAPSNSGIGYIVPEWIDTLPQDTGSHTTILLPLKGAQRESFREELRKIDAASLLFLRQLACLECRSDGALVRRMQLQRTPAANGLARVVLTEESAGSRSFWVFAKTVPRPEDLSQAERQGLPHSTITIALPELPPDPMEGRVFAFLPTQLRSGFPFLLNADFLTSPSRESIVEDAPWNRWLFEELPGVVVAAALALSRDGAETDQIESCAHGPTLALRLVPDPARLAEPFIGIWARAREMLAKERFLPALSVGSDRPGLKAPLELTVAPPELLDLLVAGNDPAPAIGRSVFFPDRSLEVSTEALRRLGAATIATKLGLIFESKWIERRPIDWFVRLLTFFASSGLDLPIALEILPTTIGLASRKAEALLPEGPDAILPDSLSSYYTLRLVSTELAAALRLPENEATLAWTRSVFRLRDTGPVSLITGPLLGGLTASAPREVILAVTQYVAHHYDLLTDSEKTKVAGRLPKLYSEMVAPRAEQAIAMPVARPESFWQNLFQDADRSHLSVLSDDYLSVPDADRGKMNRLLGRLGGRAVPPPRRTETTILSSERSDYENDLLGKAFGYTTRDVTLSNYRTFSWLDALAPGEAPTAHLGRIRALVQWLASRAWNSSWDKATLRWESHESWEKSYRKQEASFDSELRHALVRRPWVPSTRGLRPPGEVFLDLEKVRRILCDGVPYLTEITDEDPIQAIARYGLNTELTPEAALRYLRASSDANASLDVQAATVLYRFVESGELECGPDESLVFLPGNGAGTGRWLKPGEVTWADTSTPLGDTFPFLEKIYKDRRHLFVELWGVREDAGDQEYLSAWKALPHRQWGTERTRRALARIYRRLSPLAKQEPRRFAGLPLWTTADRFAKGRAFIGDDDGLARRFDGKIDVFWLPERATFEEMLPLCDALEVAFLSGSASATARTVVLEPSTQPVFLTPGARLLLAYSLYDQLRSSWDRNGDITSATLRLEEGPFTALLVRYEIAGIEPIDAADALALVDGDRLFVAKNADPEEVRQEVAVRLAAEFGAARSDLEDIVFRALTASPERAASEIRRKRLPVPPEDFLHGIGIFDQAVDSRVEDEAPPALNDAPSTPRLAQGPDSGGPVTPPPTAGGSGSGAQGELMPVPATTAPIPAPQYAAPNPTSIGPSPPGKPPATLVEALIQLQSNGASQLSLNFPLPVAGPNTGASLESDLDIFKGLDPRDLTEARVRTQQVLKGTAASLNERAWRMLLGDYGGRCQVCNQTFLQKTGDPDMEVFQWRPAIAAGGDIHYGNVLSLCAWHHALMKRGRWAFLRHGGPAALDATEIVGLLEGADSRPGEDSSRSVALRFFNVFEGTEDETRDVDANLRFCEPHWVALMQLVKPPE